jgi:triosephosphate isomerase
MNGSKSLLVEMATAFRSRQPAACDTWLLLPSVFVESGIKQFSAATVQVGAQNLNWRLPGAFTGEIDASLLKEVGCRICLVGHSERRQIFGETDDEVVKKTKACIDHDIQPLVCVGETLLERQAGEAQQIVAGQIGALMEALTAAQMASVIIAYEPIWAIGTHEVASADDAQAMHAEIRRTLKDFYGPQCPDTRLLYGGSVRANGVKELLEQPDINGVLVGGASLNTNEFLEICNTAAVAV